MRLAYLHGFASSPLSRKGVWLRERLAREGLQLHLPDLNRPSFARLSHAAALAALDELDAAVEPRDEPWLLVGSSFGGWLAARFAELHPAKVAQLVLLCPGFDLSRRWPQLLGPAAMERWREQGALELPNPAGVPEAVHYAFYLESRAQPPRPEVPCPTLIVHGTADTVVPVESSRAYAEDRPGVRLVEVEDDHTLARSTALIGDEIAALVAGAPVAGGARGAPPDRPPR